MKTLIAVIDQGTTSSRCIIFDQAVAVAQAQKPHRQLYPQPGWVEHDPIEIVENCRETLAAALEQKGLSARSLAGLAITNQRETVVAWNRRTGRPYANAIVWQDTRTAALCEKIAQGRPDRFEDRTGLPISTYFSAPKIRWLIDHTPALARDLVARPAGEVVFGTLDAWLVYNLCGGPGGNTCITDVTNAGRTMLMNIHSLQWDVELLKAFDVPMESLPLITPSASAAPLAVARLGNVDGGEAEVPILSILGDQQAALVGHNAMEPGQCKSTLGTGCFILLNTGSRPVRSQAGLLTTLAYQFNGHDPVYALEGSIAMAGSLLTWLVDQWKLAGSVEELLALAQDAGDNGGVYLVPAFGGLLAPHWRSDARGLLVGLTHHSSRAQIARAALEAVVFQTYDVLAAMAKDMARAVATLSIDGGMSRSDLLLQLHADILNFPVRRCSSHEATALGAARAAAQAAQCWATAAEPVPQGLREFTPQLAAEDRDRMLGFWHKAVERAKGWL
ncbi:MAG: glycerol kinase GlpK [Phycisphaerales bacterium]|nr:glycerol kinase GlpK [Phycisphaerales bacterium]